MNSASAGSNVNAAQPALLVRDVHVQQQGQQILRGVSFDAHVGEVCAVMGVSGAGKTTVLRSIAALQPFNRGSITVDGVLLQPGPVPPESRLKELRRRVGVVFQHNALFPHLSVVDNVTLAPVHALGRPIEQARQEATGLLGSLGVRERAGAFPSQLSGGEAQRVAIARALALDPRLLLMDEPTSALDPARRGALGELLRSLAAAGRGILIVTHDVDFAKTCADRVVVIADGTVVESGSVQDILPKA
jgi:ABC-type polar amino acid transport system ATPase subunit